MAFKGWVMGLLILALTCSCNGGGGQQPVVNNQYWNSPTFMDLAVSQDGEYLTAQNGGWFQFYDRSLNLISEFQAEAVPGYIGDYVMGRINPLGGADYRLYTNTSTATPPGSEAARFEQAYLTCLDESGAITWSAQLDPSSGVYCQDFIVAPDGTHYLGSNTCVQAIGANGEPRWTYPTGVKTLAVADDGMVYGIGTNTVFSLAPDGSLRWEKPKSDLFGNIGIMDFAVLVQQGASPLLLFNLSGIYAFDSAGTPLWAYEDTETGHEFSYVEPQFSGDTRVYFRTDEAWWDAEARMKRTTTTLTAINPQTGAQELSVPLEDDAAHSLLAVDSDGSAVVLSRHRNLWDMLSHFSPTGELLTARTLTYPSYSGIGQMSPTTGTYYYQTMIPNDAGQKDFALVAIDLSGTVQGMAVAIRGEWKPMINPSLPK